MNRMKLDLKNIFLLLFLILSPGIFAQETSVVQIKADTTKIRIGEQIKLSLEVQADSMDFVDFPDLKELGEFEVVHSTLPDTLKEPSRKLLLKNYYITAWDSGQYSIPPVKIGINDSIISTDSIPGIEVLGVKLDTINQPAYGFKNILNVNGEEASAYKKTSYKYLWALLLLFIPVIYYLYKKRKHIFSPGKKITAYEQALSDWDKLKREALWKRGETDKHYLALTTLLKNYLEKEPRISAKEKISTELLQELKTYRFENGEYFQPALLERLEQALQRADLAKYANMEPPLNEIDLDMNIIKDVIDQSHEIIASIEEEKRRKEAEIEAAKKRKKRILYTILGVILVFILSLGGITYYFLNKYGVFDQVSQNLSAPEWVYGEYGASPALGVTTPFVLSPYDFKTRLSKEEKMMLEKLPGELSVYTDENFIKGYGIIEFNLDLDKELPQSGEIGPAILQMLLKGINARNVKMEKDQTENGTRYSGEFEMDIPTINITRQFEFEAQTYSGPKYVRLLIIAYKKGSEENKNLADKVLNSAELIKE